MGNVILGAFSADALVGQTYVVSSDQNEGSRGVSTSILLGHLWDRGNVYTGVAFSPRYSFFKSQESHRSSQLLTAEVLGLVENSGLGRFNIGAKLGIGVARDIVSDLSKKDILGTASAAVCAGIKGLNLCTDAHVQFTSTRADSLLFTIGFEGSLRAGTSEEN